MSVGPLRKADSLRSFQSNSPTRLNLPVVDPRSCLISSLSGMPDRWLIVSQLISCERGPDVLPFGFFTRIGFDLITIVMRRMFVGAIPASLRHPATVVSLDVTCGYVP